MSHRGTSQDIECSFCRNSSEQGALVFSNEEREVAVCECCVLIFSNHLLRLGRRNPFDTTGMTCQ